MGTWLLFADLPWLWTLFSLISCRIHLESSLLGNCCFAAQWAFVCSDGQEFLKCCPSVGSAESGFAIPLEYLGGCEGKQKQGKSGWLQQHIPTRNSRWGGSRVLCSLCSGEARRGIWDVDVSAAFHQNSLLCLHQEESLVFAASQQLNVNSLFLFS